MLMKHSGETTQHCEDAVIVPRDVQGLSVREIEQSLIDEEVVSREQVQKLNAVADFELRKIGV